MVLEAPEGKICTKCKEYKSLKDFGRSHKGKYKLRSDCKECRRLERFNRNYKQEYIKYKDKIKENTRLWQRKNTNKTRFYQIKTIYGVTREEYNTLKIKFNNTCGICKKKPKYNLAIDHCHKTGKIRGLLCRKCNSAIGFLNDDPNLVKAALEYLINV